MFFFQIAIHAGALSALATATAAAFYYIDEKSGYLAIPYTLWAGFCAFMAYTFYKNNKQ